MGDVVEWVAAALPMTAPLRRSECLPTSVAGSPSSADKADKETKCFLPAQLLLWGEQHRQQLAAGSCPVVTASCLMSPLNNLPWRPAVQPRQSAGKGLAVCAVSRLC